MYYVNNKYYSYNKSYTMSDSMLSTLNIISQREPSYAVGGNVNWCCYYRKHIEVPKNLKIELPYDPKIPLLGIQTRL